MLIALLMDLVYGFVYILTSLIDIPDLPPQIEATLTSMFDYIRSGYDILANFFDLEYLFTLFAIVIARSDVVEHRSEGCFNLWR